ncbi:hypothetical protein DL768_008003 [Monosporascus sp. mg162]|nr:hypothetical protein DL768_008003 [Monosporascus sp. mg162]
MMTREHLRRRSPGSTRRRRKERRDSREQLYNQQIIPVPISTPYHEQEYPDPTSPRSSVLSSSSYTSSTSSSLLNISQSPRDGLGFRTFFSGGSGSERKHRRRVKKKRSVFGRNSSSSSVDSDLAYGRGYIERRRSREFTSPSGRRPRRDEIEWRRPSPPGRKQTDEEIIELGRKFAELARQQNHEDLRTAGRKRPSRVSSAVAAVDQFHRTNSGKRDHGAGGSKPYRHSSSDDSEWESASEDESYSSSSDSGLAYGLASSLPSGDGDLALAYGSASHLPGDSYKPARLNSASRQEPILGQETHSYHTPSVVDPKLFGPVNSLRGYVQTPCGFERVEDSPSNEARQRYERPVVPSGPTSSDSRPLQRVYPVPTSDPARFDAARGSIASIHQQDASSRSRPAPVPLQHPKPVVPVSSKVFESVDTEFNNMGRTSSGKTLAGAAAAGLAGAALGAAMSSNCGDDDAKREERVERCISKQPGGKDEKRKPGDGLYDDRHEGRHEKKDLGTDRDYESEMRRQILARRDDGADSAHERETHHREMRPRDYDFEQEPQDDQKIDQRKGRNESDDEGHGEDGRIDRSSGTNGYRGVEGPEILPSQGPIDPFQFQVSNDAFQTPSFGTPKRPLTPNVVTVDREPDFSRLQLSDNFEPSGRLSRRDEYERELRDAQKAYESAQHATASIDAAAMTASVPAVMAGTPSDRDSPRRQRDPVEEEADRDVVQEAANRYYREREFVRKIKTDERQTRSRSPERSVVDKWKRQSEPEIIEIVEPPESQNSPKQRSPYGAPNADVLVDNILDHPKDLSRFQIGHLFVSGHSMQDPIFKSKDPSADRERPMLNIVRPTPTSSPMPKIRRPEAPWPSESRKGADIGVSRSTPDVVLGPRGEVAESAPTFKVVSWGENQTKRYVVESPFREDDPYSGTRVIAPVETLEGRSDKENDVGAIAAAVAGAGATAASSRSSDDSNETGSPASSEKRASKDQEEERISFGDSYENPPIPGPKPPSPRSARLPGGFAEDPPFTAIIAAGLEGTQFDPRSPRAPEVFVEDTSFAANIAAGLEGAGFDPNIVIDDPSFHTRDPRPGSSGPTIYRSPFVETVDDLGIINDVDPGALRGSRDHGFVIGELPETPADENEISTKNSKIPSELNKRERRAGESTASSNDTGKSDIVAVDESPTEAARTVSNRDESQPSAKPSRKEHKRRDTAAKSQARKGSRLPSAVDAFRDIQDAKTPQLGDERDTPKDDENKSKRDPDTFGPQGPVDSYKKEDIPDISRRLRDEWTDVPGSLERSYTFEDIRRPRAERTDVPGRLQKSYTFEDIRSVPVVDTAEEWKLLKRSWKESRGDSSAHGSTPREEPDSARTVESPKELTDPLTDSRGKKVTAMEEESDIPIKISRQTEMPKRDTVASGLISQLDTIPEDVTETLRASTDSFNDGRKGETDVPEGEWEDMPGSFPEADHVPEEEKPPDRGIDPFESSKRDVSSVESGPSRYDDAQSNRNGSPSRVNDSDDAKSTASAPGVYERGDGESFESIKDKKSSGNPSLLGRFKSSMGMHDEKNSSRKSDGKKNSFLDNADTLGAGVGSTGTAIPFSSQGSHSKATDIPSEKEAHNTPTTTERRPSRESVTGLFDSAIVEREIRPAIDPQYGDLLPLPPSASGSPVPETDELPALPDSRPETPEHERYLLSDRFSHSRRHSGHDNSLRTKSPSHSAVPLQFRMGHRHSPSSPASLKFPRTISPSPEPGSASKTRARPTSWGSSREFKPLYLVEKTSQEQVSASAPPEEQLPELPPSEPPSRESPSPELQERGEDVQYPSYTPIALLKELELDQPKPLRLDTSIASDAKNLGSQESTPKAEFASHIISNALDERITAPAHVVVSPIDLSTLPRLPDSTGTSLLDEPLSNEPVYQEDVGGDTTDSTQLPLRSIATEETRDSLVWEDSLSLVPTQQSTGLSDLVDEAPYHDLRDDAATAARAVAAASGLVAMVPLYNQNGVDEPEKKTSISVSPPTKDASLDEPLKEDTSRVSGAPENPEGSTEEADPDNPVPTGPKKCEESEKGEAIESEDATGEAETYETPLEPEGETVQLDVAEEIPHPQVIEKPAPTKLSKSARKRLKKQQKKQTLAAEGEQSTQPVLSVTSVPAPEDKPGVNQTAEQIAEPAQRRNDADLQETHLPWGKSTVSEPAASAPREHDEKENSQFRAEEPSVHELHVPGGFPDVSPLAEPSDADLTVEEPVVREPAGEELAVEEPTVEEPTIRYSPVRPITREIPPSEKPAAEEAPAPSDVPDAPLDEELVIEEFTTGESPVPGVEESLIPTVEEAPIPARTPETHPGGELTVDEPTVREPLPELEELPVPAVEEPLIPAVEEAPIPARTPETHPGGELTVDEPTTGESQDPVLDESPVPVVEESPIPEIETAASTSTQGISPTEKPAVEEFPAEESLVPGADEPTVSSKIQEVSAVEEYTVEERAVEERAVEEFTVEEPAVAEPAVEESTVEKPATGKSQVPIMGESPVPANTQEGHQVEEQGIATEDLPIFNELEKPQSLAPSESMAKADEQPGIPQVTPKEPLLAQPEVTPQQSQWPTQTAEVHLVEDNSAQTDAGLEASPAEKTKDGIQEPPATESEVTGEIFADLKREKPDLAHMNDKQGSEAAPDVQVPVEADEIKSDGTALPPLEDVPGISRAADADHPQLPNESLVPEPGLPEGSQGDAELEAENSSLTAAKEMSAVTSDQAIDSVSKEPSEETTTGGLVASENIPTTIETESQIDDTESKAEVADVEPSEQVHADVEVPSGEDQTQQAPAPTDPLEDPLPTKEPHDIAAQVDKAVEVPLVPESAPFDIIPGQQVDESRDIVEEEEPISASSGEKAKKETLDAAEVAYPPATVPHETSNEPALLGPKDSEPRAVESHVVGDAPEMPSTTPAEPIADDPEDEPITQGTESKEANKNALQASRILGLIGRVDWSKPVNARTLLFGPGRIESSGLRPAQEPTEPTEPTEPVEPIEVAAEPDVINSETTSLPERSEERVEPIHDEVWPEPTGRTKDPQEENREAPSANAIDNVGSPKPVEEATEPKDAFGVEIPLLEPESSLPTAAETWIGGDNQPEDDGSAESEATPIGKKSKKGKEKKKRGSAQVGQGASEMATEASAPSEAMDDKDVESPVLEAPQVGAVAEDSSRESENNELDAEVQLSSEPIADIIAESSVDQPAGVRDENQEPSTSPGGLAEVAPEPESTIASEQSGLAEAGNIGADFNTGNSKGPRENRSVALTDSVEGASKDTSKHAGSENIATGLSVEPRQLSDEKQDKPSAAQQITDDSAAVTTGDASLDAPKPKPHSVEEPAQSHDASGSRALHSEDGQVLDAPTDHKEVTVRYGDYTRGDSALVSKDELADSLQLQNESVINDLQPRKSPKSDESVVVLDPHVALESSDVAEVSQSEQMCPSQDEPSATTEEERSMAGESDKKGKKARKNESHRGVEPTFGAKTPEEEPYADAVTDYTSETPAVVDEDQDKQESYLPGDTMTGELEQTVRDGQFSVQEDSYLAEDEDEKNRKSKNVDITDSTPESAATEDGIAAEFVAPEQVETPSQVTEEPEEIDDGLTGGSSPAEQEQPPAEDKTTSEDKSTSEEQTTLKDTVTLNEESPQVANKKKNQDQETDSSVAAVVQTSADQPRSPTVELISKSEANAPSTTLSLGAEPELSQPEFFDDSSETPIESHADERKFPTEQTRSPDVGPTSESNMQSSESGVPPIQDSESELGTQQGIVALPVETQGGDEQQASQSIQSQDASGTEQPIPDHVLQEEHLLSESQPEPLTSEQAPSTENAVNEATTNPPTSKSKRKKKKKKRARGSVTEDSSLATSDETSALPSSAQTPAIEVEGSAGPSLADDRALERPSTSVPGDEPTFGPSTPATAEKSNEDRKEKASAGEDSLPQEEQGQTLAEAPVSPETAEQADSSVSPAPDEPTEPATPEKGKKEERESSWDGQIPGTEQSQATTETVNAPEVSEGAETSTPTPVESSKVEVADPAPKKKRKKDKKNSAARALDNEMSSRQDSIPESVQERVQDPVQKRPEEPAAEVVEGSSQELVQDLAPESVQGSVQGQAPESGPGMVEEPVQEPNSEAVLETVTESGVESVANPNREAVKEHVRDVTKAESGLVPAPDIYISTPAPLKSPKDENTGAPLADDKSGKDEKEQAGKNVGELVLQGEPIAQEEPIQEEPVQETAKTTSLPKIGKEAGPGYYKSAGGSNDQDIAGPLSSNQSEDEKRFRMQDEPASQPEPTQEPGDDKTGPSLDGQSGADSTAPLGSLLEHEPEPMALPISETENGPSKIDDFATTEYPDGASSEQPEVLEKSIVEDEVPVVVKEDDHSPVAEDLTTLQPGESTANDTVLEPPDTASAPRVENADIGGTEPLPASRSRKDQTSLEPERTLSEEQAVSLSQEPGSHLLEEQDVSVTQEPTSTEQPPVTVDKPERETSPTRKEEKKRKGANEADLELESAAVTPAEEPHTQPSVEDQVQAEEVYQQLENESAPEDGGGALGESKKPEVLFPMSISGEKSKKDKKRGKGEVSAEQEPEPDPETETIPKEAPAEHSLPEGHSVERATQQPESQFDMDETPAASNGVEIHEYVFPGLPSHKISNEKEKAELADREADPESNPGPEASLETQLPQPSIDEAAPIAEDVSATEAPVTETPTTGAITTEPVDIEFPSAGTIDAMIPEPDAVNTDTAPSEAPVNEAPIVGARTMQAPVPDTVLPEFSNEIDSQSKREETANTAEDPEHSEDFPKITSRERPKEKPKTDGLAGALPEENAEANFIADGPETVQGGLPSLVGQLVEPSPVQSPEPSEPENAAPGFRDMYLDLHGAPSNQDQLAKPEPAPPKIHGELQPGDFQVEPQHTGSPEVADKQALDLVAKVEEGKVSDTVELVQDNRITRESIVEDQKMNCDADYEAIRLLFDTTLEAPPEPKDLFSARKPTEQTELPAELSGIPHSGLIEPKYTTESQPTARSGPTAEPETIVGPEPITKSEHTAGLEPFPVNREIPKRCKEDEKVNAGLELKSPSGTRSPLEQETQANGDSSTNLATSLPTATSEEQATNESKGEGVSESSKNSKNPNRYESGTQAPSELDVATQIPVTQEPSSSGKFEDDTIEKASAEVAKFPEASGTPILQESMPKLYVEDDSIETGEEKPSAGQQDREEVSGVDRSGSKAKWVGDNYAFSEPKDAVDDPQQVKNLGSPEGAEVHEEVCEGEDTFKTTPENAQGGHAAMESKGLPETDEVQELTPRHRTPSPGRLPLVNVDLSPTQPSSHIQHERPFDQSTRPGKKVRRRTADDVSTADDRPAVRDLPDKDNDIEGTGGLLPVMTPRRAIAASYFDFNSADQDRVEEQNDSPTEMQFVEEPTLMTPSRDIAVSYLESKSGANIQLPATNDVPLVQAEQAIGRRSREPASSAKEIAASLMESHLGKSDKHQKGSEDATLKSGETAAVASTTAGNPTETENQAESLSLRHVKIGERPLSGEQRTGNFTGVARREHIAESPVVGRPQQQNQSESQSPASHAMPDELPESVEQPATEIIKSLDGLDTSEQLQGQDGRSLNPMEESNYRGPKQQPITPRPARSFTDFGRGPTPSLPPVAEEPHEDVEETRVQTPQTLDKALEAADIDRDSGFVMDSPHLARRSFNLSDAGSRDSGVHMRDWPESTPQKREVVFVNNETRARLSRESSKGEVKGPRTPQSEERRTAKSPLGGDAPRLDTIDSQEKSPKPGVDDNTHTPEPKKPRSTKYQDLGLAEAGGAALRPSLRAHGQRSISDNSSQPQTTQAEGQRRASATNTSTSRLTTPPPLNYRTNSFRSSGANTPPLALRHRRISGNLRSISHGNSHNSSHTNLPISTASPNLFTSRDQDQDKDKDKDKDKNDLEDRRAAQNTTPVANEGRVRAKDMTDVYDGYGEGRIGSPRSPTRPQSLRRRQSMQVLELESKIEALLAENRMLSDAKAQAEQSLNQRAASAIADRDANIEALKASVSSLQAEISRLREVNDGLNSANNVLALRHNDKYSRLESKHAMLVRELEEHRDTQGQYSQSLQEKDIEIQRLREQLETSKSLVRELQKQILASKPPDAEFLRIRNEDYFDHRCQQLCSHVQQWVLRFSKFSDMRACRLTSEINDEKIIDRLDNTILDGSDVDDYLSDRVRRRDIFMSMTMNMIWEFVFTRYLFGMDREHRQKLKSLEKLLSEVGPLQAVRQWRAVTLTLLSKRPLFGDQRNQDTEAVVQAILQTLSMILPPPSNLEDQIQSQLRRVMREAVDLSIEMRTQRAEYMMLPPLQPEYDANGDLVQTVAFNASLMNERSGDSVSNEELEAQGAIVRVVLFPLVVKKGEDTGAGDDEVVVCPAQVLVAKPPRSTTRMVTPSSRGTTPSALAQSSVSVSMQDAPNAVGY